MGRASIAVIGNEEVAEVHADPSNFQSKLGVRRNHRAVGSADVKSPTKKRRVDEEFLKRCDSSSNPNW